MSRGSGHTDCSYAIAHRPPSIAHRPPSPAQMPRRKLLDVGSWITIAVTLILFAVALFVKGVPHDLLLEAGVFLVSVKLVIMSYKNAIASDDVRTELRRLREALAERERE